MRVLSKRSMNNYRKQLDSIEEKAVKGFAKKNRNAAVLFTTARNEAERSVYRSAIIDDVYARMDMFTAQAQIIADDLFEEFIQLEPSPHEAVPFDYVESEVRYKAFHLFRDENVDEFLRVLETMIREQVRGAASNAIAENVEYWQ